VAVADGVKSVNSGQVGEEVPSSVPELHMGSVDIRPCLISNGKHRSESSPVSVEIAHEMRGGGWRSCPMVMKPGAKGARGCEEQLHQSNCQMAR
jgi:hypothetical protein